MTRNNTEVWYELHVDGECVTGSQDIEGIKRRAARYDNAEIKRVEK